MLQGFSGGSGGKESTCSVGDLGSIPGLGRSHGGGHGNPLQHSYLENPHGQRSLVGYTVLHRIRPPLTKTLQITFFTLSFLKIKTISYLSLISSIVVRSSVQFSHSVMSDSLRPHETQHTRPPCPSPTPAVHSDSRPLSP